jgi:endogenous inhibitor of DNA gyrase (YacG/DUF329 family)
MDAKERKVPCPACRQPSLYGAANRWRPFCSERCRATDLGAWATESYRVPAQPPADADDDAEPSPARH